MSYEQNSYDDVTTTLRALQAPIYELQDLLHLLVPLLNAIGLLPTGYDDHNTTPLCSSINIPYHIPLIQHALLEKIAPTWESALRESGSLQLLMQYFCPIHVNEDVPAAVEVITLGYSTILSIPLTDFSVHLLQRLSACHSMVKIHNMIFQRFSRNREVIWEDYVRNFLSIPTRIANSIGMQGHVPPSLENSAYLQNVCLQCEQLIAHISSQDINNRSVSTVVYLLSKLAGQGVFPPTPPVARSQVSFFNITMSAIRRQLEGPNRETYTKLWCDLTVNMPPQVLHILLRSIFSTLQDCTADVSVLRVKTIAQTLGGIFGAPLPVHLGLWESVSGLLVNEEWHEILVHGVVFWISGASFGGEVNLEALQALLDAVLSIWMSPDHVKYTFISRHRYMTTLLLVTVSHLPSTSEKVKNLILSPSFVAAIGYYISHIDDSVRLCGMLAAEVLSSLGGRTLTFNVWDGEDETRLWALHVRELIKMQVDANNTGVDIANSEEDIVAQFEPHPQDGLLNNPIVLPDDGFDSDDSVTGYSPSASSPSLVATLTELAEIEKEPILSLGVKRISQPLYLSQLGILLRSRADNDQNGRSSVADNVEIALGCAEDLIRRKRYFGSELNENANNLVHALLGLQDHYDTPQFDTQRQAALNALVSSCPRLAAPCIIEEFFQAQYSLAQRFAALEALVWGAQELSAIKSREEPPLTCRSHSAMWKQEKKKVRALTNEVVLDAESSDKTLSSPRTKLLQVKHRSKETSSQSPYHTSFTSLSTPYFISPLISRFWLFLKDEQSREQRTALRDGRNVYHGAGTGLILHPVTLAQFLRTLAILTHLSRSCPEWLTIVAPETLEIALTIGTLPVSRMELESSDNEHPHGSETGDGWECKEAAVLTAALELVLVVLDGCLVLDHGRFLCLQRAPLLGSTSDWGRSLFSKLNQGIKVSGGGGLHETALVRAVTGVLLKADEIMAYWNQSMTTLPT